MAADSRPLYARTDGKAGSGVLKWMFLWFHHDDTSLYFTDTAAAAADAAMMTTLAVMGACSSAQLHCDRLQTT